MIISLRDIPVCLLTQDCRFMAADLSPTGWKCISHHARDLPKIDPNHSLLSSQIPNPIQYGIDLIQAWAGHTERSLASSNNLFNLFDAVGFHSILHEVLQIEGDLELRTALTVELAEAASSIILKFAKLLQSEDESVSLADAENTGKEMVACAKEEIFWTRLDFNVVIGQKPVYFTKTILLPKVLESDTSEEKLRDVTENLPKVQLYDTVDKNNETYAVREVEKELAKTSILETPEAVIPTVINGNSLPPVVVENVSRQETDSKDPPKIGEKKVAFDVMEVKKPQAEQKKPLSGGMSVAAPAFQARKPLPHEMTSSTLTQQQKKPLPQQVTSTTPAQPQKKPLPHEITNTASTQPQRKPLPHERAIAGGPATAAPRKLLPHQR
jgi:hypothetical protein